MNSLKILIVDDDIDFAEGLAELLDLRGHRVTIAVSGEQATDLFRDTDFDITFLDVKLPGMTGVECCRAIRDLKPGARVVLMTGYSVDQRRGTTEHSGALEVLQKPLDLRQVFHLLTDDRSIGVLLLADDDPDFARSTEALLTSHGYVVIVARDGRDAVNKVLAGGIDVMLLDLRLPVLNGVEVYRELKRKGRVTPTVIVTAYAAEEARNLDRLNAMSAKRLLRKPFDPQELLRQIESVAAEIA